MLLSTRKLVLESAGLSVETVHGREALTEAKEGVLVLCYSLSDAEQVSAVNEYRSRYPAAHVLILGEDTGTLSCDRCEMLSGYAGPVAFLQRVCSLAARESSSR